MSRPTKYTEIKNCNKCKQNINYRKFRKVNPLSKVPNKEKKIGWTDIKSI